MHALHFFHNKIYVTITRVESCCKPCGFTKPPPHLPVEYLPTYDEEQQQDFLNALRKSEDEKMADVVEKSKEGMVVFRRRMLD